MFWTQNFFNTLTQETSKPPTPTQAKPFKFHLTERLGPKSQTAATSVQSTSSTLESHPEVPMAEAIARYQKATPPRFRRSMRKSFNAIKNSGLMEELTLPRTPNLSTKHRVRSITIKSSVMEEEEEIEKMKQWVSRFSLYRFQHVASCII